LAVLSSFALAPALLIVEQGAAPEPDSAPPPAAPPFLRVELPQQPSSHPLLQGGLLEQHELWHPMCSTDHAGLSQAQFEAYVARHKQILRLREATVVNGSSPDAALNLVFNVSGSIPSGALAAIAAAEAYLEGQFPNENATVTINLTFQVMSSTTLGGTSSSYGYLTYADTRTSLVGNADPSDSLQALLPGGNTIAVRYNGNNNSITNEDRVFWTFANFRAVGGSVAGADANMTFNSIFTWDFDPSNGVASGTYSFRDVLVHETGHALGFTSGGDFRYKDMEVLDLFRFQTTDGSGDYNPDNSSEFTARPRLVSYNKPNDSHHSDLVAAEWRMSDGSPYQMSHFREQASPHLGIMDPAFAAGETYHPSYFHGGDGDMFDAIGYDR
jgi:hypothetical protein